TIATAGMGEAMTVALKAPEVATTLNAAMKAKEAWQGAEGLTEAEQLTVNVAKGGAHGLGNVAKDYEEGTTPQDVAMKFAGGVAAEVIPGKIAEGIKEHVWGEAIEQATEHARDALEKSTAVMRMLAKEHAASEIGTLKTAATLTEKPVHTLTDKVIEETTKSSKEKDEEAAKERKEAAEK